MTERDVFEAALELAPEDRGAYLDGVYGGHSKGRLRLEALLKRHDQAGTFLEKPVAPAFDSGEREIGELPGAIIGPYKLLEQIGEGGMGVVFMAEQEQPLRRKVALKILKPGMDTRQVIARFESERQALALMDHPNIAKVLDGGATTLGRPFFVMELVKGVTITEFCDQNCLTPRQRLELFIPVCQAVQHAHQKGVIHRDLKPSNVLVALYDDKPVPKVIDFGVVKAAGQPLTEQTLVTGFGSVVGTLEYMSPEQAEFNQLDIDTRSDIYSLGVLVYELLTGSPPFTRKDLEKAGMLEMLRLIREQEPSKPSTKLSTAEGLPILAANRGTEPAKLTRLLRGELDWIVMKALEKDRNRRYETANGFARDLDRYLADEPVVACPPSRVYRLRKFARRNKGTVLSASLVLAALVIGIVGTTWGMIRATDAQEVTANETKQKEIALRAAQRSGQDAQDQLFLALESQARAGRFSRQMGQRFDSLTALAKAARIRADERLRDEAIAALALPDVRRVPGWRLTGRSIAVAYGGQYRSYARASADGTISIRSIPDDQPIVKIASGPILGNYLYVSRDERFVLCLGEGYTLHVWRVADRQSVLRDEVKGCRSHAFSPDGRRLAVSQQDWLVNFDLATGQELSRWRLPAPAHTLAIHSDNRKLAVGYFNRNVVSIYDMDGGLVTDLPVGGVDNQIVAWRPDGDCLAVAGSDPRIQIWNLPAKRKIATLEGHVQDVDVLTFHPDGQLLASHSWDGVLRIWDPATGRPLLALPLTLDGRPQFSGDGRWLGATLQGESVDLLEVMPSREYRTLVSSAGATGSHYGPYADISPDGRLLALGMDDGARLWDLRNSREVARLPKGTTYAFFDGGAGTVDTVGSGPLTSAEPSSAGLGGCAPTGKSWRLLTCGSEGLLRWPITSNHSLTSGSSLAEEGKSLRLGPPQKLSPSDRAWFARGPDGNTLAVVTDSKRFNKILDLETGSVRQDLGIHPDGAVRALSADGRWVATCGWHSDRVRLWDAGTGKMVHEWVSGTRTAVFFTPDSQALIIARGDEFSFWDVKTFQLLRRLPRDVAQFPGWVAFSPEGKLMALEMAPAVIHLKEVATGQTLAKFEDPHGDRATWQGFTPDGTQLVVVAKYARAIHVWDLRAIRAQLRDMKLDWHWPKVSRADANAPARDEG